MFDHIYDPLSIQIHVSTGEICPSINNTQEHPNTKVQKSAANTQPHAVTMCSSRPNARPGRPKALVTVKRTGSNHPSFHPPPAPQPTPPPLPHLLLPSSTHAPSSPPVSMCASVCVCECVFVYVCVFASVCVQGWGIQNLI